MQNAKGAAGAETPVGAAWAVLCAGSTSTKRHIKAQITLQ